MTRKNMSITAAMLITLSLPLAQAAIRMPTAITVDDLAKETLTKKALKQVQASATLLANEADQLRMITNAKCSPDLQLAQLTALKNEVNRMGREIGSITVERESLAPWEQRAVNQVEPLLQATAANTESAIKYFSENRDRLWTEAYRDYADRVWQDSEQIAKILKNFLKYDKLRDQEVQLEKRIWADSDRTAE